MKVFFDLACMSTCCWGLPKSKYETFITHNRVKQNNFHLNCKYSLPSFLYLTSHRQGLQRIHTQEIHNPRPSSSLDGMRRLQKLDLSGNNLTTLPRGLFKDLDSLSQLLVRGNPWYCGCNLRWLHDWLHERGSSVTVRGLTCHGPERVRGMTLRDLTSQLEDCEVSVDSGSLFTLRSRRPGHKYSDISQDSLGGGNRVTGKSLLISVKPLTPETVHITWQASQPVPSFRLSWLRLGNSPAMGSITETLVPGDRREYLLTQLQPQSSYIICLVPLSGNDEHEHPACAKTETDPFEQPISDQDIDRGTDQLSALPLAGIIGGATALVSLFLIFGIFCWYGHRAGYLARGDHSVYGRDVVGSQGASKHYDDYVESGTIKDTSILEIRAHGFQMTPMSTQQPLQPKAKVEDMTYIHTIFPSNNATLYRSTLNHTGNPGYGTNRGYREGGIPDIDYSYT
uniref:Fibronectin leucine rich transmembrane protein 1 n=1 Tax=Sinocyclocheilus grahami TaxID=75366 RepID=A0A672TC07_SINGR